MVGRRILFFILVLVLAGVVPASAGTASNPEVRDACGLSQDNLGREPVNSWEDICSAWFDTAGADGGVVVTMRTGALQPRTPTFHSVSWRAGDCQLQVGTQDATGPADPAESALYISCGSAPTPCTVPVGSCTTFADTVTVPLDGAVTEGINTVSFTIRLGAIPAAYRDLFDTGSAVRDAIAFTGPVVVDQTFMVWGPCSDSEFRCDSKVGDWTPAGRTFVIGS
jgi:hypothetical protein